MARGYVTHVGRGTVRSLVVLVVLCAGVAALLAPAAAAARSHAVPHLHRRWAGRPGPRSPGAMVVWTDNRNGNLDIYGKNLSTGKDYAVCTNTAQQDNPAVTRRVTSSGKVDYVAVWVDKRNHPTGESTDIYGRDITTGERFEVGRQRHDQVVPGDRRPLGDLDRGRRRRGSVPDQGP